jgi:NADH:ubiquinone oxidoreductase subunit 5 (subunit L)/multisubunit Na+/H+ antiporter MnhA subunit
MYLEIVLIAVIAWTFYHAAKRLGRNGFIWSIIAVAVFLLTQTVCGITLLLITYLFNWKINIEEYSSVIVLIVTVLSLVSVSFVSAYLHYKPKQTKYSEPPPPPNFN